MAVTPTTTFNHLMFGSVDSADYGIYISGPAAYNAPKRAYELVAVPGRNGEIMVDQGHWENIAVTYDCGTFAKSRAEFSRTVANFRNAIASQVGYQRLTDTYNPDEYRMGLYAEGIEVETVNMNTAGQFSVTFNCKPQRWLTSGEAAISVASGSTLMNPTLYPASPLLVTVGPGVIDIAGQELEIFSVPIGHVTLADPTGYQSNVLTRTITFDSTLLNTGDPISVVSGATLFAEWTAKSGQAIYSIGVGTDPSTLSYNGIELTDDRRKASVSYVWPTQSFVMGTAKTVSDSGVMDLTAKGIGSNPTIHYPFTASIAYDGDDTITYTIGFTETTNQYMSVSQQGLSTNRITGESTLSAVTDPIYIDLGIGEAYTQVGGTVVSVNDMVSLGGDLPVLPPGAVTVTYDNTITSLSIEPRWWQL